MGFSKLFLILSGLLLAFTLDHSIAQSFRCNSTSTCRALVGYTTVNNTNLGAIQSLLNVTNLPSPLNCVCYNGTGTSSGGPTYTVRLADGLFHIAAEVFSRLVLFPQIAAANNILDPNLINVGQSLQIPLPCSCDDVDGEKVVHYAHVVKPNSSLVEIAQEFGTDEKTLARINGIIAEYKRFRSKEDENIWAFG